MALTINTNTMNPVPLWTSKDYWQCNQRTFHDAMAWPVVENGMLPAMALTMKGTPAGAGNVTLMVTYSTSQSGISLAVAIPTDWNGMDTVIFSDSGAYPKIYFIPQGGDMFKVVHYGTSESHGDVLMSLETGKTVVSREQLKRGGSYTNNNDLTMTLSPVDLNYLYQVTRTITIKRFQDNTTAATVSETMKIRGCVPYRSADRNGRVWIGGHAVTGTFADGVYYLEFSLDNTTYYSEPFMWLTTRRDYTHIQHRSSRPIVTTENVIWFDNSEGTDKWLGMWIDNIEQRPPYQFNPEVTDIDGRKFAEKQVSFYNRHLAFNCYEAFLDAIRLLWHCDIRYMGSRRIDYMEPPEMDWNTDNHLCDVVLEMSNYDDVLQTNGTASAYNNSSDATHSSYDASFDASFD